MEHLKFCKECNHFLPSRNECGKDGEWVNTPIERLKVGQSPCILNANNDCPDWTLKQDGTWHLYKRRDKKD